jgi:hypothetical protein
MKALSTSVVIVLLLAGKPALADQATEGPGKTGDLAGRARASFLRGVDLYEERDFSGAGVEFRRAYELMRNFRILFNLGRVAVELHDYAAAIDLFTRYLAEGGDQVPPERRRELQDELAHLRPRVGHIKLLADDAGAEVYLDDVLVGHTPIAPLIVNVGQRRLEIRPAQGPRELRIVDAPGDETVVVRMGRPKSESISLRPLEPIGDQSDLVQKNQQQKRESSSRVWLGWTATGLCAASAAVFGVMAYRSSKDLKDLRQSYPTTREALDDKKSTTRTLSVAADASAAGAVVFGALSLYLSVVRGAKPDESKSRISVGLSWPGGVNLNGQF